MSSRPSRPAPKPPVAPMHRGPQAVATVPAYSGSAAAPFHAPNAALLIDFDNVTMGIRSDLGNELRNLLSSDIIKGKVAVQRAYADWRRYPQYVVPLAESSIDMIWAPAYGSSKKNATDIRLAVDAMEMVFTRPEIGTYILLSGDSDFASLVLKLKEYGKYVIGVGIRESSSDLLVMNCDEYYSYNALAGLVKAQDEETPARDPWELVSDAVQRMKRNGDVMRADRLKQVMQDIDPSFDEKDVGVSKFSRFCQEAAQRGLIKLVKLDSGQLEVDVPEGAGAADTKAGAAQRPEPKQEVRGESRSGRENVGEESGRRGRRGRGGRGRRGERESESTRAATPAASGAAPAASAGGTVPEPAPTAAAPTAPPPAVEPEDRAGFAPPITRPVHAPAAPGGVEREMHGERLTRDEAFDLVRRAVATLTRGDGGEAVPAAAVRVAARELLGRDSESLNERLFLRILQDAHDADVIDLRRHGDGYEVAPAAEGEAITEQLRVAEAAAPSAGAQSQGGRSAATAATIRRGLGLRGGRRGRQSSLPPELLTVGVVDQTPPETKSEAPAPTQEAEATPKGGRKRAAKSAAKKTGARGRKRASKSSTPETRSASASTSGTADTGETTKKPRASRGGSRRKKAPTEKEG